MWCVVSEGWTDRTLLPHSPLRGEGPLPMLQRALAVADALIVFAERLMRAGVIRVVKQCALQPAHGLSLLAVPHQDQARFTTKVRAPGLAGDLPRQVGQPVEVWLDAL